MIPIQYQPYIDEDSYRDCSIALDIFRHNKCPLYLQVEYIVSHPTITKKANQKTLSLVAKDIDKFNETVKSVNNIITHYNNREVIQHMEL
jgi:hypothetical protein